MRLLRLILVGMALLLLGSGRVPAANPFGTSVLPRIGEDPTLLFARLRGLGVGWLRAPTAFLQSWDGACAYCTVYGQARLGTVLVLRNQTYAAATKPSTPPTDLTAFSTRLGAVLDAWKPTLLVVEQHETDPAFYAPGGDLVASYVAELTAACTVSHARHIPCANGGLSSDAAWWLGWQGLLKESNVACDFAGRGPGLAADKLAVGRLCAVHKAADLSPDLHAQLFGGGVDALFAAYRKAPLDAINFEWHSSDARGLAQVTASLAAQAGKPVISTDFGPNPHETDPNAVRPLLRAAYASGLQIALWNTANPTYGMALFAPDGTLTQAGWEFQRQMAGLK